MMAVARKRSSVIVRLATEASLIVFMLYAALLMREFTSSSALSPKTLGLAISDVLTAADLGIAVASAVIGTAIIEYLSNRG